MTISYNWLCTYLPLKPSPEELSSILTAIGLEVESLEPFEAVKGSLEGLVIGEVLSVAPHPNADKLRLTRVDTGEGRVLGIVCGAPNVAAGQKVVVAPAGSTIYPLEGDPITLKKTRIRGEQSEGMICAEDEIGLGKDHEGILVLDGAAAPGMPAAAYFKPYRDWVYEIGLTPNRMDAMSHLGVARDVCAYLSNRDGTRVRPERPSVDAFTVADHSLPIQVRVENTADCPRYAGLTLSEVQVAESPAWLRERLVSIGVRPVNNVVDITNFVLHECGQPLHAFDAAAIRGGQVLVRNLPEGTPFVTLDGKERKLSTADLMVCDAEGPMCIAGVFGGLDSGVREQTRTVFLESAFFNPISVRRSSFRHDLRTDAAQRFEKGVDISGVLYALKRAALLMTELCGARVAMDIVDVYPSPDRAPRVNLSLTYLEQLSGRRYGAEAVKGILDGLGFGFEDAGADMLSVSVPAYKRDVSLPADLVEEIMRIDGYDRVEIPTRISLSPAVTAGDAAAWRSRVAGYLVANGFYEIFTNSLTSSRGAGPGAVRLMNSLSAELDVMRSSMLGSGLDAIAYNLNRRQEAILFFEWGKTYFHGESGYEEKEHLALYFSGPKRAPHWKQPPEPVDGYFVKGHLENIFALLGAVPVFTQSPEVPEGLDPARTQRVDVKGRPAGWMGPADAGTLKARDVRQPVWYADLDWAFLRSLGERHRVTFEEIPRYPTVRRDLALILDKNTPFAEVEKTARALKSDILERIQLFDIFESEKLGQDKKSYAVSFIFRHRHRTLTDKEIDGVMGKLIRAYETQLKAGIRK